MKWKLLIGLLVILAGLFFTNPNKEDYREFFVGDIKAKSIAGTSLESMADRLLGDGATFLLNKTTDHTNYLFWSVYETSIFGYNFRYVGIATMFIDVSDEEVEEEPAPED